jgi:hypothetical protein
MKRHSSARPVILGLLAVALLAAGIVLGGRVLSQSATPGPDLPAAAIATPAPGTNGEGFGTVEVGPAMPAAPTANPETRPATVDIPAAPELAPASAGLSVKAVESFDKTDLSGWTFGQIYQDPIAAGQWSIRKGQIVAPDNSDSTQAFNDTIAAAPASLQSNGSVEASVYAGTASKVGLIVGYQDDQNYTALIFRAKEAPGRSGLEIVRVSKGTPKVLAKDTNTVLEHGRWYHLSISVVGQQIAAAVDDGTPLTAQLPESPIGQRAGLYAGSEGFAFFDNFRVLGQ